MSQGCGVLRFDVSDIVHKHLKTLPLDLALSSAPGNQFELWLPLPSALGVRKRALLDQVEENDQSSRTGDGSNDGRRKQ
jgi:hypothetical protein